MRRSKLILQTALAGAALALVLSGCSTGSRYYGNDGPPAVLTGSGAQSAEPRVEPFRTAANKPYTVLGSRYTPITTDSPLRERGTASWYGKQFHGNKTSTGEIYDMYKATAAHPTMPLPSYARVTNLENGRSIIVRVNDRGPFLHNRIIDLSYAAAKTLGYSSAGTARVEVSRLTWDEIRSGSWRTGKNSTPVTAPTWTAPAANAGISAPQAGWGVQIGSFSQEANARSYAAHAQAVLEAAGDAHTVRIVRDGALWRVVAGGGLTRDRAAEAARSVGQTLGVSAFSIQK
ncbi:septal ring lytic transglycosylase RlpA family protein [uncultured Sutterella sp.]|uniref:septal ring lytic transglycosylase RlpA family protein n=1 Tax=uncultured Sutterella sp. TaxID=286133 RepID=UPI0025D0C9FC|nr:septal ring lytic transglycosylase RlpA family protein [uncultured Sutterella sp.]